MSEEKTESVPPSKGVMSNFGFFSKHLSTDLVSISIICINVNHIMMYKYVINISDKPKGSKVTLPDHKEAQVALVVIHKVLL